MSWLNRILRDKIEPEPLDLTTMLPITFRLPNRHIEEIEEIANRHGLSRADVLRQIITEWLELERSSTHD